MEDYKQGWSLRRAGRLEEAADCYRRCAAAEPEFAWAPFRLGEVLLELGRVEDARTAFLKALTVDPLFGEAYLKVGELFYEQGDYSLCHHFLKVGGRICWHEARAPLLMGRALHRQGRIAEAIGCYKTALLRGGGRDEYYWLGVAFLDLEQTEPALHFLVRALELNPEFVEGFEALARLLSRLNRPEQERQARAKARSCSGVKDEEGCLGANPSRTRLLR